MQRVSQTSKIWRTVASKARINVFSINDPFASRSFSAVPVVAATTRKLHQPEIPSSFQKWGSVGFFRTSKFASGFNPLQRKPLDLGRIWSTAEDLGRNRARVLSLYRQILRGLNSPELRLGFAARLAKKAEARAMFWVGSDERSLHNIADLIDAAEYSLSFLRKGQLPPLQTQHMVFTGLEDYKARGTQAAPYFTVSFYTEFAESKDLVLIRGDVVFTSKLTDSEAKWLLEAAQSFYLNDARYKLVERFNRQTHDFEFKDVLQVLDMPIL
ncbi:hypothetical protein JHK86_016854 [Glycine max]|nr:hypothetical protein JHK86_016854 [Glycine max]